MGPSSESVRIVGRYALYGAIASGGMATVHFGRLLGPVGFSRTVAIKRLHAQYAQDPEFVSMFLDEARLAARIRHPNVVPTLDVVATGGELFLIVMDYVSGESLARLTRGKERPTLRITSTILTGVLHGLHAAHEARDERGMPLGIVHRDVSPQNVLVGVDGVPKILDFGVAKAAGRTQTTRDGQIKGKLAYMAPEQLRGTDVTRTSDIYAAGVLFWELLTGERLFYGENEGAVVTRVLEGKVTPPSRMIAPNMTTLTDAQMRTLEQIDRIVLRAVAPRPEDRYPTAREMALDLERVCDPATASVVGAWCETAAREILTSRAAKVAEIESRSGDFDVGSAMAEISGPVPAFRADTTMPMLPSPGAPFDPAGRASSSASFARQLVLNESASSAPVPRSASFIDPTPPVTQPSSISVSAARRSDVPPRSNAPRIAIALAVLFLIGGGVAVGVLLRMKRMQTEAASHPGPTGDSVRANLPIAPTDTAVGGWPSGSATAPDGAATSSSGSTAANANGATTTASTRPIHTGMVRPMPTSKSSGAATTTATPTTPTTTATTATTATATTATATTAPTAPPPAEGCTPPFFYDDKGVKRYKPQCL